MMSYSLKSLVSWVMFALGIFAVVYASNLALSELGNKAEWDKLTLSMWNSLVSHVEEKLDKVSVSTEVSLWNSDVSVPSQNAVKTYVDGKVEAASGWTCDTLATLLPKYGNDAAQVLSKRGRPTSINISSWSVFPYLCYPNSASQIVCYYFTAVSSGTPQWTYITLSWNEALWCN